MMQLRPESKSEQCRRAKFAGAWYSDNANELDAMISQLLASARQDEAVVSGSHPIRFIIAPHAGYSYSAETASRAYRQLDECKSSIRTIFILGPSHNYYLSNCHLTQFTSWETPLGNLKVNKDVVNDLHRYKSAFEYADKQADRDEHSIELQLPLPVTIVPVIVGKIEKSKHEAEIIEAFKKYMEQPSNLFIISTDFCHWGKRFGYQAYDKDKGPIYKYIESLDKQAMDIVESLNAEKFSKYLNETQNTICGRSSLLLLLKIVEEVGKKQSTTFIKFLAYHQSSKCDSMQKSSVSYASGFGYL